MLLDNSIDNENNKISLRLTVDCFSKAKCCNLDKSKQLEMANQFWRPLREIYVLEKLLEIYTHSLFRVIYSHFGGK